MAICLNNAVVRGEIDNTIRGSVIGRLWLVGREEPLEFDLDGNAWRDVAGARVAFVNPHPRAQKCVRGLATAQRGIAGDITVSRKVNDVTVDDNELSQLIEDDKPIPYVVRNALYLEWFSEQNGRVVVESPAFEVEITEFAWQMDEAEEQAQQLMNQHAMRDWLATIIQRPEPDAEDDTDAFSEAAWEESLKQSDRLSLAHLEALEKYGDEDDEDETRVAFVMGWDHLLDAMTGESEQDGIAFRAGDEEDDDADEEGEEWKSGASREDRVVVRVQEETGDDDEDTDGFFDMMDRESHPLVGLGTDLVRRVLKDLEHELRETEIDPGDDEVTALDRFISNVMTISGKMAGVLSAKDFAVGFEAGHTLAILKRCLNWSNEALSGLNALLADPEWEGRFTLFGEYKRDLHAIRDAITDLRQEIRAANPGV